MESSVTQNNLLPLGVAIQPVFLCGTIEQELLWTAELEECDTLTEQNEKKVNK